jgi:VWFA-related protein
MFKGAQFRFTLLAVLLSATAAHAQQTTQLPAPASSEVQLDVVVTPKSGPPIAELRQQDFTVLDNKAPQSITSFKTMGGNDAPVKIIIVVDAVNAYYQTVAYERTEISKFLKANGGHLAHPTALAFFTDTGTQIQNNFTSDGNALDTVLDKYTIGLRTIQRSQGFYGANDRTQLSLNAIRSLAEREASTPGRKLVLWISPGWPILSGPGIQLDAKQQDQIFANVVNLSTQLRQNHVTLYSIDSIGANENLLRADYYQSFLKGVSKPGQTQIGDLSLQVLAVQSGGLALNSTGVSELLQRCVRDADAYYELTFASPRGDNKNEYHSLDVKVDKPGLTARTRAGYYAQP